MQTTDATAPGLADTAAQVQAARAAGESKAAAQQSEARTFIQTHGAAALAGHEVLAAEL